MAEDTDFDRTEPASPRRLEQAREEGQVARSQELATFAVLAAAMGGLWFTGGHLVSRFGALMRTGMAFPRALAFDPVLMLVQLETLMRDAALALLPLALIMFVAAIAAPLLLNGWVFSANVLAPDFERLNPARGLQRILSLHSAVELGKAIVKAVIVGGVAAWVIWQHKENVFGLASEPLGLALGHMGRITVQCLFAIVGAMILIVGIDVPFQLWEQHRKLRMTRDEVRREAKETEGDPQVKSRIRSLQREAARKRMMAEVPNADVVVTNPTHYAVALRYEDGKMRAPQVVAKGRHLIAARIRELAQLHRIPILEAPPLARALYRHTELGDCIPEALYTAVAEVLAYVYQLRRFETRGGTPPRAPLELAVPPGLDPEVVAQ